MVFSKLFRLNLTDWQKALIVSILSTPISIIYTTVEAGSLTFDWSAILKGAIIGFCAYAGKNFLTGFNGRFLTDKPVPLPPPK